MKIGLVLEGGAMRGMYTAGVLDVYMKYHIHFDSIVGVSAGALFGVNYLSGQTGRVIRYNKRFNRDPNYLGLLPLLREGNIVSTRYAYEEVPLRLDPFDNDAFRKSGVPFYAVLTDVETGTPEYVEIRDVFAQMDVLRASGSLPFVSKPVVLNGRTYLDGGITDSIPWEFAQSLGCNRLVIVLTRDKAYRKSPISPLPVRLRYGDSPLSRRMLERHEVYNRTVDTLNMLEEKGEVLILRPSRPVGIGHIETKPKKLEAVYEMGIRDAIRSLPRLQRYLSCP